LIPGWLWGQKGGGRGRGEWLRPPLAPLGLGLAREVRAGSSSPAVKTPGLLAAAVAGVGRELGSRSLFPPSPPPPAPPHGAPTALAPSQPPSSPPPHPVFAPPGAPSHPRKLTGPRSPERELTLHCFLWGGSVSSLGDSHCQNPAECQGLRLPALIPLQDPITLESFLILIKSLTLFKCPATYSPL
jgi:hypothetical protein